jgi:hypothetical protein
MVAPILFRGFTKEPPRFLILRVMLEFLDMHTASPYSSPAQKRVLINIGYQFSR